MPPHAVSLDEVHLKAQYFNSPIIPFQVAQKNEKVYFITIISCKQVTKPEILDLQVLGFFFCQKERKKT